MKKRLPEFKTEREAAVFWASHDSTDYLDDMEPVEIVCEAPRRLAVPLGESQWKKLRRLAAGAGLGCEALAQKWIVEQLRKTTRQRRNGKESA